jgi:alkylhydroperoxidase family enzyme
MLKPLIRWRLRAAEKRFGESVDYLRHTLRYSVGSFFAFAKAAKASQYRKELPAAPFHVARIVTVRHEDCGPCVQVTVNLAKEDRVPADVLRTVLDRRPYDLPEALADVYHFAEAVAANSGGEAEYRERIRKVYGEAGLVELSLAIATCRLFPVFKRGLGFARSCSLTPVQV